MDLDASIGEFFQAHVNRACRQEGVAMTPSTEFYLVGLLSRFGGRNIDDTPLALRLAEALEAPPAERRSQLRAIGDTSLFVSGFWTDSLLRGAVPVDYYIGMGESAYGALAHSARAPADPNAGVFAQLAQDFSRFVRVLQVVSDCVAPSPAPRDLVDLYDRWRSTGSPWAKRRLAAHGLILTQQKKPD